jgi:sugar lactone lactonase YvrE
LGESPVWCPQRELLLFVDISGRRLLKFNPASGALESSAIEEDIGCVAPSKGGGFVAGLRSGIWLLNEKGQKQRMLAANPEDSQGSRFNDGRVDCAGRFLAGTLDEGKASRAALYRYDRRGLIRLTDGLITSNGLAFSPDGRTLYHSDTPRFVVYRYDYDASSGSAENRRVFVQLEPTASDRGRVQRYDPEGRLMSEHAVPARNPTMPAFGGLGLNTLFVTTARDVAGSGGGLYAAEIDVPGLATFVFDPTV